MSQPAQQIRFCTSRDGTRIAYATSGAGPPLIWAANWTHHLELDWDNPVWRPWLTLLTRRHTLVRYDVRGCGLSDRKQVDFSLEGFVEDLEAVVQAAGHERFVLLGMGAGSAISTIYSARHPDRVSQLVLYAGYVRNKLAGSPTPRQVAEADARLNMMELGWLEDTPAYDRFYASLHIPDASAEQTRAFADLCRRTTSSANAVAFLRVFYRVDLREIVPQVRCPTLVLHTRGDSVIRFEQGRSVAGLIPGARFVPLDSRNHLLLDTEPAWRQFVAALDDFLPTDSVNRVATPKFPLDELTPREHEVLELVAQGLDNGTIGARLGISERTARNHVSTILSKLGVGTRAQAIVRARESGFGRGR